MKKAVILSALLLSFALALPAQADYMAAKQGYYRCVQQCMGDMSQYTPGTNEGALKFQECMQGQCANAYQTYLNAYTQLCMQDQDYCMNCQKSCNVPREACEKNAQTQPDMAECGVRWEMCFEGCLLHKGSQ